MRNIKALDSLKKHLKRPLKKLGISSLVGILMVLSLLFQVWVRPALTQQPVTITIMAQGQVLSNWKPFFQEFQDKNPDIRINVVEGPFDTNLQENLLTSAFLLGDSPYDILNMDIVWVPKFAAAGWLKPLDDRLPPEQIAEMIESNVEGGRYQGKLYRVPTNSDAGVLYYRKDLLEQAGAQPPETFQQMVALSQQLQGKQGATWGYLWQGKQYEGVSAMFVEVLGGFGGFWVNPDTLEVGLDQPQAIQAVEFLRDTINKGISPSGVSTYGEEETRMLFQNGGSVFLRNWPYVWKLANQEDSKVKGKIGIKVMLQGAGQQGGSCLGGWGLGMSATTKHPEEAWRLMQYLSSKETMRRYVLGSGEISAYKSLFKDPEIVAKYPHFPQLLEAVQQSVLRPPIAQYAQASDILQRYLSAAFTGGMNSKDAMQAAAQETRNLMGSLKPARTSQHPRSAPNVAIRS
ncbi:ABC transporter substrate-binding protein [Allocoleopsis sp.]|uniref:ABC transporter substrate-binding protein n=1 Tax=Allocoleopsis sp. TaxID=3088169 RepID=UPI002FCF703F